MSRPARPVTALAGLGFGILAIAGTLAQPSSPDFAGEPAAIATFFGDNEAGVLASSTLYLLAAGLLLVFAAAVRAAGRRAEGGDGTLSTAAFAGCAAGATLALGASSLQAMGALRVQERGDIDPAVATALFDGGSILYGLAAPVGFGVFALAVATLALRHGLFPAWHGVVSAILGVALLIPPISYVAVTAAFTLWVLGTSVMLYLRAGEPAVARVPLDTRAVAPS